MNARESLGLLNRIVKNPENLSSLDPDSCIQLYIFILHAHTLSKSYTPEYKDACNKIIDCAHHALTRYDGDQIKYLKYISICGEHMPFNILKQGLQYQHRQQPLDTNLLCAHLDYKGCQTRIFYLLAFALDQQILEPSLKLRSLLYSYANRDLYRTKSDNQSLEITSTHLDMLLKYPIDPKEYKDSFMRMMSSVRNHDVHDANPDLAYFNMKLYASATGKTMPLVYCEWLTELQNRLCDAEKKVFQGLLASPELYGWSTFIAVHFQKNNLELRIPTQGTLKWFDSTIAPGWKSQDCAIAQAHPDIQSLVDPMEHNFSPKVLELWKACTNQHPQEPIQGFDFSPAT